MKFGGEMKNFGELLKNAKAPLTYGLSIGFGIGAITETVVATVKAVRKVDAKAEKEQRELSRKEIAKESLPCYKKAIAFAGASFVCSFMCQHYHNVKYSELAGVYLLAKDKLEDLDKATKEVVGEKKAKEIKSKSADISSERSEVSESSENSAEVLATGQGNALFYIDYMNIYFRSDPSNVNKALEEFNAECMWQANSAEDLATKLCLPIYGEWYGSVLGWNNGERAGAYCGEYKSRSSEPCRIITFHHYPHADFD